MAIRNGIKIGLALGEKRVTGAVLGGKGSPSASVSLPVGGEAPGDESTLIRAFGELKGDLERLAGRSSAGAEVHVALLPPLADARVVPLPPMRKAEAEAVLSRDVARYFLGANRPRVVGVHLPQGARGIAGREDAGSVPVLAAASSLALLETVRSAVRRVGWVPTSLSAGHGAWISAASSGKGDSAVGVVAVLGSTAHVLRFGGRDPVAVRQVSTTEPSSLVEALGDERGPVLILGDLKAFEVLRGPLSAAGFQAGRDPEGWPGAEEGTAARAARAALRLVPPTLANERMVRARKGAVAFFVGAAVLIFSALGTQLWGTHRELRAVQAQRASIRAEVAPLVLARDSLNALKAQVQSLTELSRNSPVWTRPLVELSALIPQDTYLTGFFASGDTVELEAAGAEAGEAIQVIREAGLFEELRLLGLVEREMDEGETVEERFRLWARLPKDSGEEGGQ